MSISENLEFKNILIKAAQSNASDLHFSPGNVVKARIDNVLVDWPETVVSTEFMAQNFLALLTPEQKTVFDQNKSLAFSFNFDQDLRFRLHLFQEAGQPAATLRFIPSVIKIPAELSLQSIFSIFAKLERGLVIISGISGAGKSTTIASLVEEINLNYNKYVILLKQPTEHLFLNKKALIEQREIFSDSPSWAQATADLLNTDAEVVVIDQLTDAATASNVLELAEKCLVVLEMGSQDVLDTINDFLARFDLNNKQEKRQILARNLIAISNQILVAKQGGGVIPVCEILLNSNAVTSVIAEDRLQRIPDIIAMSGHEGMISRERALAELVKNGAVVIDEALKYVNNKEGFKEMILK